LIDEYKGVDYVIGVGTAAKEGVNCDLAFTDETETYDLNPVIENSDISVIHIKNFKRTGDFMLNVATITVKPTNAKTFVKIGSNDIIIKSGAVFIDNGTDDAWTPFEFNGFLLMAGANAGTRRYIVNTPGYVMPYSESFSGAMFISGANINTITNNSSGSMNISGANINTITNNSSGSIVVNGAEIGHIINNSSGTVTMANSRSVYYVCNNANATLKVHTGYSSIYAVGGSSATVKITGDDIYYYGHLLLSHPGVFDGVSRTYYLSRYIVFHKPASSISINVTSPAVAKGWSD
jgi:hypothetical protein